VTFSTAPSSANPPSGGSGSSSAEAERTQRLAAIAKGAKQYTNKDYAGAVETLGNALAGSPKVFTDADKPVLDKARDLLEKAKAAAKNSGSPSGSSGASARSCPSSATSMTLQVCSVKAKPGESVSVPVWLLAGSDLANLNANIGYDASVAQASGKASKGERLGKALFDSNLAQSGLARFGFAGSSGINGSGQIASIPFKVMGKPGQRTPLRVTITTANDASGSSANVAALDGEIIVEGDPSGAATPTVSTPSSSSPVSKPTTPAPTPAPTGDSPKFTTLDALSALKMSLGLLATDMKYDLDKNQQVTSNDARLILMKAVGK
jgi:hypothetical protein